MMPEAAPARTANPRGSTALAPSLENAFAKGALDERDLRLLNYIGDDCQYGYRIRDALSPPDPLSTAIHSE
jgi:hypothetical protein